MYYQLFLYFISLSHIHILTQQRISMKADDHNYKLFIYAAFASILVGLVAAITLVAILGAYGFIGFDGGTPIVSGTCSTEQYIITKYQTSITNIVEVSFICSIAATLLALILFVILLTWVLKMRSQTPQPILYSSRLLAYILASCFILTIMVPFGYYLSVFAELPSCTDSSYNSTATILALAISAIALFFALFLWIILLSYLCKDSATAQKYRELQSNPTEQNQRLQQQRVPPATYIKEQRQPYVSPKNQRVEKIEQTKENIFDSPSKRPLQQYYIKQPIQKQLIANTYSNNQTPIGKTPSYLEPKSKPQPSESRLNYIPASKYIGNSRQDEGQLVFSKSKKDPYRQDQQTLQIEQKRYLSRYGGGGILPSSGVQQKESRQKGSQYFRSNQPPRRYNQNSRSPPKKGDREGMLLSFIRGKYAN